MMYLSMGYPAPEDERRLLLNPPNGHRPGDLPPVLTRRELLALQAEIGKVRMDSILVDYILSLVTATRESKHLSLGVSPRGALALKQAARARALFFGRNYCIPDDIKQLAVPVLCHRVIPASPQGGGRRQGDTAVFIHDLVENLEIPV
jgi:MoxR-like ATPase